jgi:hypothetical protein
VKLRDKKCGFWAALMLRCRAAHLLPAASVALAGTLASASAFAQGTAVLTGTVIDSATKKPLGDVVVTVTSPALQGEQTVVTDKSGSYRIPNLPPGAYTLRLDADAYRPYSRGNIALRVDSTIRVNAELLPESIKAEEVVVVGKAPTVDVGSSSTGITIDREFTNRVALNPPSGRNAASRSFENLATVAPGAQADQYGVSINGTTSPENNFVIDGLSVNNPAYGILGTPLSTEFVKEVGIITGGYMPEYGRATGGVLDVVTKSGSNEFHGSVFFNITPGALEGPRTVVKRDGTTISTNPFLSSLRDFGADVGGPIIKDKLWFYAGVDVAFTRFRLERSLNEFQMNINKTPNKDGSFDATGAYDTDGPYQKDKKTGFVLSNKIPGTDKTYFADQQAIQYIGKLTYLINQDNNLTLSVYGQQGSSGGHGAFGFTNDGLPEVGNVIGTYGALAHHYVASANDISLKYSSAFNNKRILLDITAGWHHENTATLPSDGSAIGSQNPKDLSSQPDVFYRRNSPDYHGINDPGFETIPNKINPKTGRPYCQPVNVSHANPDFDPSQAESPDNPKKIVTTYTPCPVQTYFAGGPDFLDESSLDRWQGRAVLTALFQAAGHHVVKGGADAEYMKYGHTKAYSGTVRLRESLGGGSFLDHRQYGFMTDPDEGHVLTKFFANSTSTTFGGFLQDSWQIMDKVTINFGVRYDAQIMYGADGKVGLSLPNQWSPRVGLIYDFTQAGRSKIFVNYARYYESVPLDIVDRSFPGEPQISASHPRKTPDNPTGCDPRAPDAAKHCHDDSLGNNLAINGYAAPNTKWFVTGGDKVPVDPDIKPQSSDEFVAGGEYEIFADARVGVQYTHRQMHSVIEDMSRDEANTYFIGNPGSGIAKDFPKAKRNYDAVTVYLQKSFSNTWLAQASYTVSRLYGNYAGLFRPETTQLDPNINSDFDLRSLLPNREGPLPGDRTHSIKLFGAKDFPLPGRMDIQVGLSFRSQSGTPLSYLGSHALYGSDEVFILQRGAAGRTPWVHAFDTHLGYAVHLSKDSTLTVTMDIFNLFNFQAATGMDQTYTTSDVLPIPPDASGKAAPFKDLETKQKDGTIKTKLIHPDGTPFDPKTEKNNNFGNPTSYQSPRQFRFGMKVTF